MMKVKEYYRKTSGNQLVHIIVSFNAGISIPKESEHIIPINIRLFMLFIIRIEKLKGEK